MGAGTPDASAAISYSALFSAQGKKRSASATAPGAGTLDARLRKKVVRTTYGTSPSLLAVLGVGTTETNILAR